MNEIGYHYYLLMGEILLDAAEFFTKGGPVMYLLLLCSITVATIGIERFRFYRYSIQDSNDFLNKIKDCLKTQNINACLSLCHGKNNSISLVARYGIEAAVNGENIELAMITIHDEEAMKLRAHLNYLSMIVTLAPLLGLLGTISGMIESFNIFNVQSGQPFAITGGIGEALIATATGLCVAIFALLVHTYFSQKLDEILAILEKTINIVLMSVTKKVT